MENQNMLAVKGSCSDLIHSARSILRFVQTVLHSPSSENEASKNSGQSKESNFDMGAKLMLFTIPSDGL